MSEYSPYQDRSNFMTHSRAHARSFKKNYARAGGPANVTQNMAFTLTSSATSESLDTFCLRITAKRSQKKTLKMSRRVRICLSKIFNDYRKEAFIYVDDNFKFVSDFEKHVRKLFDIKSKIYLTIGNCLLPSSEFVNVIQSNDNIMYGRFILLLRTKLTLSPETFQSQ